MEGDVYFMDQYILKPSEYVICDPAFILLKTKEGDAIYQQLIKLFYKAPNSFQHLVIEDISFYMFRNEGGDGIFDGIGTDSGTFVIVDIAQIKSDSRFRQDFTRGKIKTFKNNDDVMASFEPFDLNISNGIHIHTE